MLRCSYTSPVIRCYRTVGAKANLHNADKAAIRFDRALTLTATTSPKLAQPISQKADVDISSPEIDFVRSIGVYQIESWQGMRGSDGGECRSGDTSRTGTYGTQGDFSWRPSHIGEAPPAFDYPCAGSCAEYNIRSVFIDIYGRVTE